MSKSKMRIAALIRVSTEKQEKQGESLNNQTIQIQAASEQLGGDIVKRYGGQEHATPGWERKQLEALLRDASAHPPQFDAVMVCDASRWSRDNVSSKQGLDILRSNGVKFYTLTQEYNLHDPSASFFLGMFAEIGEYQARIQKKKSVESCIERARRTGAPTGGKKPFGRKWNKGKEVWELVPEKKAMIQDVAERYLKGEQLPKLAAEYGVNHAALHKTLTKRSGDSYTITWDLPDLKIQETITISIPPLLSNEMIRAIHEKAKANRTYQHGRPKYRYLLSGYVFCAKCGYAMFGQTNHNSKQYYRHAHTERAVDCPIKNPRPWVSSNDLEHAVIEQLFEVFGNQSAMKRAIEKATPNQEKLRQLHRKYESLMHGVKKTKKARDRILKLIVEDTISKAQAKSQLDVLNEREKELDDQANQINTQLGNQPSLDAIEELSLNASRTFRKRLSALPTIARKNWDGMNWQDKRDLVEMVFGGTSSDGLPHGVYISVIEGQQKHRKKRLAFKLHGHPMIDGGQYVTQSPSR